MSIRILQKPIPGGHRYVIQFRHPIFFWRWEDAWVRLGESVKDYFDSLEDAKKAVPLFVKAVKEKAKPIRPGSLTPIKDLTEDPRFWMRLSSFVEGVHVSDLPGMEEKDMILNVCREKTGYNEIGQK